MVFACLEGVWCYNSHQFRQRHASSPRQRFVGTLVICFGILSLVSPSLIFMQFVHIIHTRTHTYTHAHHRTYIHTQTHYITHNSQEAHGSLFLSWPRANLALTTVQHWREPSRQAWLKELWSRTSRAFWSRFVSPNQHCENFIEPCYYGHVPTAAPPEASVTTVDVVVGDGEEAVSLSKCTMKYVGKLDDGHVFDSANKFSFTIDAGEVIKGWDTGVKGMRVGGRRTITCPPKFAYGKRGSPPDIPPSATLTFDVTLLHVK
eukprot:m.18549 g.18549  ORF g.18549 m.18549 type:complete len:261 (-) comp11512_c0_seq5:35-817(-)